MARSIAAKLATGISLVFLAVGTPGFGLDIPNEVARGSNGKPFLLRVSRGFGLNVSFLETGEVITKAWLDDPSRIVFSVEGNLCPTGQNCTSKVSQIIHLKQINPIDFPQIPSSADKSTLLTVITQKQGKKRIYSFRVVPVQSNGGDNLVNILSPNSQPVTVSSPVPTDFPELNIPNIPRQEVRVETPPPIPSPVPASSPPSFKPLPTSSVTRHLTNGEQADFLVSGLMWRKSDYPRRSGQWRRINTAIALLRQGESLNNAAIKAKVPLDELQSLVNFARGRNSDLIRTNAQKPLSFLD
ncbi:hypothetical protein [Merismopedia glauca]|uniref:Uncharacterized protein n=1 Tax=Merismopedia glauca CCAP 1448/3 TaxID=1296344 RepID=A0A2T1C3C9_9CYAN|nr:hypothetical protein [Merismopedia glauca]PSB02769.1 hypothetical protein C7B64_11495 [Merismopedia glauca CCAP 1448/3]